MAEQRKKSASVLLQIPGKTDGACFELFAAEQWQSHGGTPGAFRVRKAGKWVSNGHKYTFFTPDAVAALLGQDLATAFGLSNTASEPPVIPRGCRVRVPNGNVVAGQRMFDVTFTSAPPFQSIDGRWYVHVLLLGGQGVVPIPVEDVTRL